MGEPVCYAHLLDEFGRVPEPGDVNIVALADREFAPAGRRALIDRASPATDLQLDLWIPQLAPSPALEDWFGNDPGRWAEFERRYRAELQSEKAQAQLQLLDRILRVSPLVLLYHLGDREHNAAVVLRKVLAERKDVSELRRGA